MSILFTQWCSPDNCPPATCSSFWLVVVVMFMFFFLIMWKWSLWKYNKVFKCYPRRVRCSSENFLYSLCWIFPYWNAALQGKSRTTKIFSRIEQYIRRRTKREISTMEQQGHNNWSKNTVLENLVWAWNLLWARPLVRRKVLISWRIQWKIWVES